VFHVQGPGEPTPDVDVSRTGDRLQVTYIERVTGEIDLSPGSNAVLHLTCGHEQLEIEAEV
jgi:hypothetical protein